MMEKSAEEIMNQFKDWISKPSISRNLGSHASIVRNEAAEIISQHNLLLKNTRTRPTVAIFGASQAGKSYLTAKICEQSDETVSVKIDKNYDFLREINPAGGRESTALVTRMTTYQDVSKATNINAVWATLLSLPDLIGIFVNIYSSDLKQIKDVSRDMVSSRIESVCGKDVLEKIHNVDNWVDPNLIYLKRVLSYLPFDLRPYTDLLRLPNGTLTGKSAGEITELFSLIWGDIIELNSLFEHLCDFLLKLNFVSRIQIPVEAFVPREISIIDVAVLSNLQNTESYSDQPLKITTDSGGSIFVPRPILCALVGEVEFVLNSPKTSLLDSVDILDFPGARSRIRRDMQQYDEGGVGKLFLRGKISHLFESATSRDEIDTLLLCMKPGPMDVATLPDAIGRWINGVAESQITRRLFILATQFDLHFPNAVGQSSGDKKRFDNAIFSAFLEPFGPTEDSWIYNFNFKNVSPIRNPNYPYNGFFIYDKNGREVGVREDAAERISELKRAFEESKNVTSHLSRITEKWKALMSPGDGGAYFLIDELSAVDWNTLKAQRLMLKQKELCKQVIALLEPFAVHNDYTKKLQQEKQKFLKHFVQLQLLVNQRNLASFVELFSVNPLDLKASVSADILFGDDKEDSLSQVRGFQVPSFLKGEMPDDSRAEFRNPKEQFFEKVVSALLLALVQELDNNIKSDSKNVVAWQATTIYFASHLTSGYQLKKIRDNLMVLSSGWTAGLKLTDNLESLCMVASRIFDAHFYGLSKDALKANTDVIANPVVCTFKCTALPSGNVSFFNGWMDHVGEIIEDNVTNSNGGANDLVLNAELLILLDKMQLHVNDLSA